MHGQKYITWKQRENDQFESSYNDVQCTVYVNISGSSTERVMWKTKFDLNI